MPRAAVADVAAAIIAGGQARRLGGRIKALIEVQGRTVLDRQLAVLAPAFPALAISANDAAPFRATGLPVLPDSRPGLGPLAGITAALAWCPAPYLLVVAGDMPYIDAAVIDLLLAARGPGVDAVVPFIGGLPEPLLALYARACLPAAEQRLRAGKYKTAGLITEEGLAVRRLDESALRAVDPDLRCFTNLNAASDLPPGVL